MTGAEFINRRKQLGMTQIEFARALGIGERTMRRYELDERAVPEPVARLVAILKPRTAKKLASTPTVECSMDCNDPTNVEYYPPGRHNPDCDISRAAR
jgi:transcriptional regulator with XRE-family HTH domain